MSRPKLNLLEGTRRSYARSEVIEPVQCACTFGAASFRGRISDSSQLGVMIVESPDVECVEIVINKVDRLEIRHQENLVCSGNWTLTSVRSEPHRVVLIFRHPACEPLVEVQGMIAPEAILRDAGYRCLSQTVAEDAELLAALFTDLKDCPVSTRTRIVIAGSSVKSHFDFAAGRKSLESLDLHWPTTNPTPVTGSQVLVDYVFLTVRYVFSAKVVSYDPDFETLEIGFPLFVHSFVNRRFERVEFVERVEIWRENEFIASGTSIDFSVAGIQIELEQSAVLVDLPSIEIRFPRIGLMVNGFSKRAIGRSFVLGFDSAKSNKVAIRKIYNATIASPLECRREDNYLEYLNLYESVGHAPESNDEREMWRNETTTAWRLQDARLPGSSLGYRYMDKIVSHMGVLPISSTCVYAHSGCMIRELEGAIGFYEGSVRSKNWTELLDGVSHYMGSYALRGRFVGRLQTTFSAHARPNGLQIIYMDQLSPTSSVTETGSGTIEIRGSSAMQTLEYMPESLRPFGLSVANPHESLENIHHIDHFAIFIAGKRVASVVRHRSPKLFTAVDIFNRTWIFVDGSWGDARKICGDLRKNPEFSHFIYQVVLNDGSTAPPEYEGNDISKPAFFTLAKADDFGPILASICRVSYSLFLKYGEAARDVLTTLS